MKYMLEILSSLIDPTLVIAGIIILLMLNSWIFNRLRSDAMRGPIIRRSIGLFIVLLGIIIFILTLPIDKTIKGQILSFLGIILSAGIALSSTTILGNLIAGFMNNSMNRFRNGDLIKIGDLHGRVTRKSVFHTEIQLEDSNFITIPNLYIATNPVKLTRKTNTVISADVSLGYDVPRVKIEEALLEAAKSTGLTEPYVYIISLGDYSVVYRIHGFLEDSNKYFSTRSLLNAQVMDTLHTHEIEIVSPSFMNQRRIEDKRFIPSEQIIKTESVPASSPEDLVFDEAIKSEKIEEKKEYLNTLNQRKEKLKEQLKATSDENKIKGIKASIKEIDEVEEKVRKNIEAQEKENQKNKR